METKFDSRHLLTEDEWVFIQHLRSMDDGLMCVSVEDGQPSELVEVPLHYEAAILSE